VLLGEWRRKRMNGKKNEKWLGDGREDHDC